jgi:hypothetical protein
MPNAANVTTHPNEDREVEDSPTPGELCDCVIKNLPLGCKLQAKNLILTRRRRGYKIRPDNQNALSRAASRTKSGDESPHSETVANPCFSTGRSLVSLDPQCLLGALFGDRLGGGEYDLKLRILSRLEPPALKVIYVREFPQKSFALDAS